MLKNKKTLAIILARKDLSLLLKKINKD